MAPSAPAGERVSPLGAEQRAAAAGMGSDREGRGAATASQGTRPERRRSEGRIRCRTIRALYDAGERFATICGTSIGAFNGAFVAQGKLAELERFWRTVSTLDPPPLVYVDQVRDAIDFADGMQMAGNDAGRRALANLVSFRRRLSQLGSVHKVLELRGIYRPDAMLNVLRSYLDFELLKCTFIVSASNLSHATSDSYYFFSGPDARAPGNVSEERGHGVLPAD